MLEEVKKEEIENELELGSEEEELEDDNSESVMASYDDSIDHSEAIYASERSSDPAMFPVWYLSWSTLIQAAKDIKQMKESKNRPRDIEERIAQNNAVMWVLNPMFGAMTLSMCHEVLFADQDISYKELGLRILENPKQFADIDMQKVVRQIKSQRFDTRKRKGRRKNGVG